MTNKISTASSGTTSIASSAQRNMDKSIPGLQNLFSVRVLIHRIHMLLSQWHHNRLTRRHLTELDDHLLKDVGLDSRQIQSEISKPFWRD